MNWLALFLYVTGMGLHLSLLHYVEGRMAPKGALLVIQLMLWPLIVCVSAILYVADKR